MKMTAIAHKMNERVRDGDGGPKNTTNIVTRQTQGLLNFKRVNKTSDRYIA